MAGSRQRNTDMRGLKALVIILGVVILAMMATIIITLAHRMSAPPPPEAPSAPVILDEPPGTRIQSITGAGPSLAVLLQGGGSDRILLIDPLSARPLARVQLRPAPPVAAAPPVP